MIGVRTEEKLSPADLLAAFGETVTYNGMAALMSNYSLDEQRQIQEGIRERQRQFWDGATDYYRLYHPLLPPVPKHFQRLLDSIDPREGHRVVDLGCGVGALIIGLLKREPALSVTGVDFAPQMLARCRENLATYANGQLLLAEADFTQGCPFLDDESADTVVSNWGISYASREALGVILPEVSRILKPGGIFICAAMVDTGSRLATLERLLSPWQAFKNRKAIGQAKRFARDLGKLFPTYTVGEWREMLWQHGFSLQNQFYSIYGTSVTFVGHSVTFVGHSVTL